MGKTVEDVINSLRVSAEKIFKWFSDNQMEGNTDECLVFWVFWIWVFLYHDYEYSNSWFVD